MGKCGFPSEELPTVVGFTNPRGNNRTASTRGCQLIVFTRYNREAILIAFQIPSLDREKHYGKSLARFEMPDHGNTWWFQWVMAVHTCRVELMVAFRNIPQSYFDMADSTKASEIKTLKQEKEKPAETHPVWFWYVSSLHKWFPGFTHDLLQLLKNQPRTRIDLLANSSNIKANWKAPRPSIQNSCSGVARLQRHSFLNKLKGIII